MSTLPDPDDDPASRCDVSDSAQVLRGEIGSLRDELRTGLAALGEAVTTLSHDVRNLGVRMDAEFVAVRGEIKAEGGHVRSQMWLGTFTAAATAGALVIAAVTLV